MDGLKELVEAFSARIKSPIIGSIILAFIAVNWRPVFFLFFSGKPASDKFVYFNEHTTGYSLYLYPVLIGLIFALLIPWINFWGAMAVESPVSKHRNMQLDAAHALAEKKTRHAIDMETLDADYRGALLNRARVEQEIKEADIDEDVRIDLEEKFSEASLSSPKDRRSSSVVDGKIAELANILIQQIGANKSGRFSVTDFDDKHQVTLGQHDKLSIKNREEYLNVLDAVHSLQTLGYLDGNISSGKITTEGYNYIRSLESKDT